MTCRCYPTDYFLIWLALVLMGLFFRPLTPIDETRAVSVAWEMWQRSDFLVPHLNGMPYSHKPPLLHWCIHLLWLAFGVSEGSARLAAPLFALGNLFLTVRLSRRLWPDNEASARLAPLILLATPVWALWSSLTLYDMMAAFFALLGLLGVINAARGEPHFGWALTALAIGGGILSKGPATLLMILPSALFAPWWLTPKPENGWGGWYTGVLLSILLGAAAGLAWAIPAGIAGGDEYKRMIFWGQSVGRIRNSFAHQRPFWWYLPMLPALWLPWTIWPPLWRSVRRLVPDSGLRFCAIQGLSVLVVFSLISGKRIHYLLPMFPAMALFASRALSLANPAITRRDQAPLGMLLAALTTALLLQPILGLEAITNQVFEVTLRASLEAKLILLGSGMGVLLWRPVNPLAGARIIALAMIGAMFAAHLAYRQEAWPYFFMQPFADRLAAVEQEGAPVAHWLKYHGDFNFLGRLQRPLVEIDTKPELLYWMNMHPQGYVVLVRKLRSGDSEDGAEFAQFYRRTRRIMLWKSSELLARPDTLKQLLD